mgnify:CR=1 FL=1
MMKMMIIIIELNIEKKEQKGERQKNMNNKCTISIHNHLFFSVFFLTTKKNSVKATH